jgi:hypothetical protein
MHADGIDFYLKAAFTSPGRNWVGPSSALITPGSNAFTVDGLGFSSFPHDDFHLIESCSECASKYSCVEGGYTTYFRRITYDSSIATNTLG